MLFRNISLVSPPKSFCSEISFLVGSFYKREHSVRDYAGALVSALLVKKRNYLELADIDESNKVRMVGMSLKMSRLFDRNVLASVPHSLNSSL